MTVTDHIVNCDAMESAYWDAYHTERDRLQREQGDVFDELSSETTRACRRAGIRRLIGEIREGDDESATT